MRVLAIDTAGPVVGVSATDGERVAARTVRAARGTEALLPGLTAEVLTELGLVPRDLQGVAVSVGPGAFTGLRVGIAAATGLAAALGVPIAPVGSLWPRAAAAGFGGALAAWLDARKGRVYAARWEGEAPLGPPVDVAPDVALEGLTAPFRVTGEGALVHRARIEAAGGVVVDRADDPGPAALVREGESRLREGRGVDPVDLVPVYVRAPDVGG